MSSLRLVLAWMAARPLLTVLSMALVALGVGTVVLVGLVTEQLEQRLTRDAQGVDLVVGARGSPLQLVLAGVYHLDVPPGNIPLTALDEVRSMPRVAQAVPLSLGDSFRGFRIVGTEKALIDWLGGSLAAGQMFAGPMQAVLGAQAAQVAGLAPGARFAGQHGLTADGPVHDDQVYTVSGVLAPTGGVLDRLIFTPLESVWRVHEGEPTDPTERAVLEAEREITLMLVRYDSPLAAVSLPRAINSAGRLLAASPSFESARLLGLLGVGVDLLHLLAGLILIMASLSVFVALLQTLSERHQELALLRLLGARPAGLVGLLLIEGLLLTSCGAMLGTLGAHLTVLLAGQWTVSGVGVPLAPWFFASIEVWVLLGAPVLGVLAALLPAWRASRLRLADALAAT
ncbi:MAG: ABC transporter permease [Burkholderiales bacterium]|jgi:putative ABC transport system permease protein